MVNRLLTQFFRSRLIWLLVGGLLIAVMVAIGIYQSQPRSLTIEDLRSNAVFPEVRVLDLLTINLRDPNYDLTFTLSRAADGTWTAPDAAGSLDTTIATQIAQTVVLLPFERSFPMDADTDLTQYGFNPNGALFVEFVLTDGTQHVLAVGGLLPARDQGYYALVDDRPDIYIIPRGPLDFLIQNLYNPPLTFSQAD
jgi:hypothetical protein